MRINITDVIDEFWGVSARAVRAQVQEASRRGEDLDIVISSVGGSVLEGLQIYHEIKAYSGKKTVSVVGIAASIASIIAMAGDKVVMTVGSMMMIHNPLAGVFGNSDDMREIADILDKTGESLGDIYQIKTKMDSKTIAKLMRDETYMTADEAVSMGFADEKGDLKVSNGSGVYNSVAPDRSAMLAMVASAIPKKENISDDQKKAILLLLNQNQAQGAPMNITKEKLKAEAPDLYNQILEEGKASVDVQSKIAEATAGNASAIEAARNEGAENERKRIAAIKAQSVPGYEAIIEEGISSGISPEAVAKNIVAAIQKSGSGVLDGIKNNEAGLKNLSAPPKPDDSAANDVDASIASLRAKKLIP